VAIDFEQALVGDVKPGVAEHTEFENGASLNEEK
jgi:hypothetical protein